MIGEGSFGNVYQVQKISDGKQYAAKIMKMPFKTSYTARQTYREIKIMRKLSEIKSNMFTP